MVEPHSSPPRVSVIIPARNEEALLGRCLGSLISQTGANFEIIVVDDHSTDRTREIAASFAGARVISARELPSGWTGKNNAAWCGAEQARGEWLLFTDADTDHLPGSLAHALSEARENNVALLSYSPEQEVTTFVEMAVMPVIFAELAVTYPPSEVSDPRSSAAAANGQYLLISREAYDAAGGHAAIAGDLLEDVVLARAVKRSGRGIRFRLGTGLVRTRMYRSWAQMREGWTKNLALLFRHPESLAAVRLAEFGLTTLTVCLAVASALNHEDLLAEAFAGSGIVMLALFFRRIRRAHFGFVQTLLSFFGLPVFAYLLWRSATSHKDGHVDWKGRKYPGNREPSGRKTAKIKT